jgi:hypothetical protein
MKKRLPWILGVLAVGVVSYWASRAVTVRAQRVEWTPFTAAIVERSYSGTSTEPAKIENYVYARRRDGSWVRDTKRQVMPHGGWGDMRVVEDYARGTRTTVDPGTESLITYPYPPNWVARLSAVPTSCSTDPNAQHETVLGYDTVIVQRNVPGPVGDQRRATYWRAPALNCFALKEEMILRCETCPGARNTREALLVSEGDPSSALFEIPANYVERTPSQVFAEFGRRFPEKGQSNPETDQRLDEAYQSFRKQAH